MPEGGRPDGALADLAGRRDALRQAVGLPGADPGSLVDAALTELDGAIDALAVALTAAPVGRGDAPPDGLPGSAERRLLHAAFQRTPAALFLLEQDSTIRRANDRAAALLGSRPGTPPASRSRPSSTCRSGPRCRRSWPRWPGPARTGRRAAGC